MDIDSLGQIGSALAKARRASRPSDIDLRSIGSLQDAQEVQDAAVMSYGGVLRGYTLAATTARTARLLNCPEPIIGKLLDEHIHDDVGASLQLNGNLVASGGAAEVFGNPIAAMLWLTHALDSRGSTLQAGDIVATGSCTGLAQVAPGQRVRAAFGHLGHVELDLV